jgi:hypothetical protein
MAFLRRRHDRATPRLPARAALVAGAVVASVAVTACGDPVTPFAISDERVAVHGVVRAGQRDLAIAISRIPVVTSGQEIRYVGVEDAVVEVSTADGPAVQLEHALAPEACITGIEATLGGFHGSGCYTATLDAAIAPGQRFDLVVRFPDGTRASGAATVPHPVALHAPAPAERIVASVRDGVVLGQGTLDLAWTAPPDVARLEVTAFSRTTGCGVGIGNPHAQVNFVPIRDVEAGALSIPFGYVGCEASTTWDSFPATVRVTAYDSVYARYFDDVLTATAVRLDRASAGLTGALGFFIGAASVDRAITFVAP